MANPPLFSRWHRRKSRHKSSPIKPQIFFSVKWMILNWKFKNRKFESFESVVLTVNKLPAISRTFTHTKQKWLKLFHRQIYFNWLSTKDLNQRSAATFLIGLHDEEIIFEIPTERPNRVGTDRFLGFLGFFTTYSPIEKHKTEAIQKQYDCLTTLRFILFQFLIPQIQFVKYIEIKCMVS